MKELEPVLPDQNNDERGRGIEKLARDKTAEEVGHELGAQVMRLSFVHAVPTRVADDFEARAVAIGKLSLKVAEKRKALDDINERLETIRKQWEPRVEDLVTSIDKAFGHNFAQITCAGEVKLRKDDDFSKWAIDIRVRFR